MTATQTVSDAGRANVEQIKSALKAAQDRGDTAGAAFHAQALADAETLLASPMMSMIDKMFGAGPGGL